MGSVKEAENNWVSGTLGSPGRGTQSKVGWGEQAEGEPSAWCEPEEGLPGFTAV